MSSCLLVDRPQFDLASGFRFPHPDDPKPVSADYTDYANWKRRQEWVEGPVELLMLLCFTEPRAVAPDPGVRLGLTKYSRVDLRIRRFRVGSVMVFRYRENSFVLFGVTWWIGFLYWQ